MFVCYREIHISAVWPQLSEQLIIDNVHHSYVVSVCLSICVMFVCTHTCLCACVHECNVCVTTCTYAGVCMSLYLPTAIGL